MSLPSGTWKINVNGTEGDLIITAAPDGRGRFVGSVLDKTINGFWDESSQTITFWILIGAIIDFPAVAIFKGYLFRTPPNPEPGRDVLATLTGFVQANNGNGFPPALGDSRRNVFGWFAQISEVL